LNPYGAGDALPCGKLGVCQERNHTDRTDETTIITAV
jgi:hypothetical protein